MRTARGYGVPLSVFRSWDKADQLAALALTAYEDSLCPGCGEPKSECMDPANEDRYGTLLPSRCFACTELAKRAEEYRDAAHPSALRYVVTMTGEPPQTSRHHPHEQT